MPMTQLTPAGYVLNHWITVIWITLAAIYTYWACLHDMLNFFKSRAGKSLDVE